MDSRKSLFILCSILAFVFLALCISVVRQQERPRPGPAAPKASLDPGQVVGGAAGTLAGGGMLDRVMGSYVDRVAAPGGSSTPAPQEPAQQSPKAPEENTGQEARAGEGRAAAGDEGEDLRLRLIQMKDRSKGERRMYGYGGDTASGLPPVSQTRAARAGGSGAEDESQVLSKFQAFIDKLHRRAAAGKGSSEQAAARASGGDGQGHASRVQIMTVDGFKGDKPPTLQLLESVNRDGADSLMMTEDPQLEDGSKDRHGKKWDGNSATFGTIPIDEVDGAFGGREIRASAPSSVDTGGAPADLKH